MLPRSNRLKLPTTWKRNKPDFSFFSPYFKIIAKKTNTNEGPKIGFIISTKVGKATTRNRLRRFLAQVVRTQLEKIPAGLEIIFIVAPGAGSSKHEEIGLEVNKVVSKLSLSRPGSA